MRHEQDSLVNIFNELVPKSIPVLSPAFRWAQSVKNVFLEVKFSTRFDSPACLDLFDHHYEIANLTSIEKEEVFNPDEYSDDFPLPVKKLKASGQKLLISAMCRNDKTLLKY